MDQQKLTVLAIEYDFHDIVLQNPTIYINTDRSSMNNKSSDMFPDIYQFLMNE